MTTREPIPGFPGYLASPDGRIFTMVHGRGKRSEPLELVRLPDRGGYPRVRIRGTWHTVHKLIALTFVGPRPSGTEVRHLDGARSNARAENLAYGTAQENAADRVRHGTQMYGQDSHRSRWPDSVVNSAVRAYLAGGVTQQAIAERHGTSQQVVSRWIKGYLAGGPNRYAPRHATRTEVRGSTRTRRGT